MQFGCSDKAIVGQPTARCTLRPRARLTRARSALCALPCPVRPASREDLADGGIPIGVPSFIPIKPSGEAAGAGEAAGSAEPGSPAQRPEHLFFMIMQVSRQTAAKIGGKRHSLTLFTEASHDTAGRAANRVPNA
jgi:hypothetical protein